MRKHLVVFIFIVGFFLRVLFLDKYPVGFTPDEASFGYDAYSLLKTGKDQWGETFPLIFRSFGDFKLPLYGYLAVPSIALFGLNEYATRFPNALLGSFAILGTYLLAGALFKDKRIQLIGALLFAFSPWHISLSRGAFEANLSVFFLSFAVYFALRGIEKNSTPYYLLSSLLFSLNLFTYHSARLFTPILMIALAIYARDRIFKDQRIEAVLKKFSLPLLLFASFMVLTSMSLFSGGTTRGADISIFKPTDSWLALSQKQYGAQEFGLPSILSRVFANKATFVFDQFVKSYFTYISPQFLFTKGAGEWTYGMIVDYGVMYFFEIVFLGTLLYSLVKRKLDKASYFLIAWYLLAILPASLTKGPGHAANRAAIVMPSLQILSAYGAVLLYDLLKDKNKYFHKLSIPVFHFLVAFCLINFSVNYFFFTPINAAEGMLYGRQELVEFVQPIEKNYEQIIMSKRLSEPHIYVAFYNKVDPLTYQVESKDWLRYEKDNLSFVDQLGEYKLGKYIFKDMYFNLYSSMPNTLLVGKYGEFPQDVELESLKLLEYPKHDKAFLIVDPSKTKHFKKAEDEN